MWRGVKTVRIGFLKTSESFRKVLNQSRPRKTRQMDCYRPLISSGLQITGIVLASLLATIIRVEHVALFAGQQFRIWLRFLDDENT